MTHKAYQRAAEELRATRYLIQAVRMHPRILCRRDLFLLAMVSYFSALGILPPK